MKHILNIWQDIDEQLRKEDDIDVDDFLKENGYHETMVAKSVNEESSELLNYVFNPELLPKNTRLSKYKIQKQINSGGQSEIYIADRSDGVYKKTVVIKFIAKRYSFEKLRLQFLQEMQLLADLNHPGIVQILDGGLTKQNQPWLVLEYIDGLHIDEYCNSLDLTTDDTVRLFVNLCEALKFVHQRGVVHMDIKASNILINNINDVAYPVIIDFGISNKSDDNEKTLSKNEIFGTAGYSAPEQIATGVADNRADIYSLGMLMAQLLTKNEVSNIGLETSKNRRLLLKKHQLSKDLICIIEKSIQQKPDNRYLNIEHLQLDLNNYLHHLPLIANQNHIAHVLYKTYKRHKIVTFTVFAFILVGIISGIKYTKEISELQQITALEKNASDELFNFMLTDLFKNLSQIGRTDILKSVTEKSIEHLNRQDTKITDSKSRFHASIAYTNAGKVFDALDSSTQALDAYEKASKNLSSLATDPIYKKDYLKQMAKIKNYKGLTLTAKGQEKLTENNLIESLQLSETLYRLYPNEELSLSYESHVQLGWYYMDYSQPQKALKHIEQAIKDANQMLQRFSGDDTDCDWLFNLSQAYQVLAWYELDYGDPERTIPNLVLATQLADRIVNEDGSNIRYSFNQATLLNQLGYIYLENFKHTEAQDSLDKAVEIGKVLKQKAPKNQDYQRELAYSYTTLGKLYEQKNNLNLALTMFKQSIQISKVMSQNDAKNFSSADDYATDLIYIGIVYMKLNQVSLAKLNWTKAIEIMTPIHLLEPNNKYYMISLVSALIYSGEYEQAKPLILSLKKSGFNDRKFNLLIKKYNL